MGMRAPTKKEIRFLRLLLSGMSTMGAARQLKVPERTAYNMTVKLRALGYIRPIPGTRSPVMYEAGDVQISFIEGDGRDGEGATKCAHPPAMRSAPDPIDGVYTGKECPEGYVEAHVNGSMSLTVVEVGTFDDPMIPGIGYVGYWKKDEKNLNGSLNRYGSINIDGQDVGLTFRRGSKGSLTFALAPKRIYLDPSRFASEEEAKALFFDRALKIASILNNTGWVLTSPKLDGKSTMEYAIRNSPLAMFIPFGHEKDNDIIVDGSPGCPEAEMTNPSDWAKVQAFANLPSAVVEAKGIANAAMVKVQELDLMLDRILDIQEKTEQAILNNTRNIASMAMQDAERNLRYVPKDDTKAFGWEGYQ